ncbi:MAG: hypothetical protein AAF724_03775 [Pseudomonadota bacterium]
MTRPFRSIIAAAAVGICLTAVGTTVASVQSDPEISVIVDRKSGSVELFLGMPAQDLVDVLAMSPTNLTEADGTVDFASLREGTWDIGDAAFASVNSHLGDELVQFEAMSMMVHPSEDVLPFSDPIDGVLAVSVCSVDAPAKPPRLGDLHSYSGFIAYADDTSRPLQLSFAETGRSEVSVEVLDYNDGELVNRSRHTLADGGTLTISDR